MQSKQKRQKTMGLLPVAAWRRHMARSAVAVGMVALGVSAQAQETFKVGVVSFLSGQAAESFGIPAVNGAKVLVDAFN